MDTITVSSKEKKTQNKKIAQIEILNHGIFISTFALPRIYNLAAHFSPVQFSMMMALATMTSKIIVYRI